MKAALILWGTTMLTVRRTEGGYRLEITCDRPGHEFRVTAEVRNGETYIFRELPLR